MTDPTPEQKLWVPVLRKVARASGHELRNALNSVVVNLEVVRSRSESGNPAVQPFIAQAVQQSEESARLAESTIALLNLVVSAVSDDPDVRFDSVGSRGVRIECEAGDSDRVVRALEPMTLRSAFSAGTDGSAVILTIPDTSSETD